jgi:L-iditol 2-dehydrogenase
MPGQTPGNNKIKNMRALMLTGLRKMEIRKVSDPVIIHPGDVKIKMKAVGVCGSDIHYYNSGRIGSQVVDFPFTLGHEGAGEVVETGAGVRRVKAGDRIAIEPAMPCMECDQCITGRPHTCRKLRFLGCPGQAEGCLSEYIVMPESSCFPLPENLGYDEAVISEPLAIGVYSVRQASPVTGVSAGVLGFGPIGMSVTMAAIAGGAGLVYATDKIDRRVEMAGETGAVWSGNPDNEDIVAKIMEKEPGGLDVIFECCGSQEAMDQALDLVKPGGRIMIVGIPEFDNWSFSADKIRRKEIRLINIRRQNHALEETLELLSGGIIDIKPMVTHRFDFKDAGKAFELVSGYRDGIMKAIIDYA